MSIRPTIVPLLPCPFCGPGNSIVELVENDYGHRQIACGRCGLHSGFRPDKDDTLLIAHWNTRPMMIGPFPDERVTKTGGDYDFEGDIRSIFTKRSGIVRVVVENDDRILHIFSPQNLKEIGR